MQREHAQGNLVMLTLLASLFVTVLAAACGSATKLDTRSDPLERIPADWIDLPESPDGGLVDP